MSENQMAYGKQKIENKTEPVMIRLSPRSMKNLQSRAEAEHLKPATLARVLVEKYVDR